MALSLYEHAAAVQDIDEAIHRLPQDVVDARMQRLKRAVDCSLKKSYLSKEIQDMQTPYSWYLKVIHLVQPHPPLPAFKLCILKADMQCDLACRVVLKMRHKCCIITVAQQLQATAAYFVIKLAIRLWFTQETWAEVQAENTEKAMLGTGKDYDRSFP